MSDATLRELEKKALATKNDSDILALLRYQCRLGQHSACDLGGPAMHAQGPLREILEKVYGPIYYAHVYKRSCQICDMPMNTIRIGFHSYENKKGFELKLYE